MVSDSLLKYLVSESLLEILMEKSHCSHTFGILGKGAAVRILKGSRATCHSAVMAS
jgi:hypothetical protein